MKKTLLLFSTLLCACLLSSPLHAYTERNLLVSLADETELKTLLLAPARWVKYPAYADRAGWEKLMGPYRRKYVERAEKYLDYEWKHVKASDYLEFFRSGSRKAMETPYNANRQAFACLLMGELAEGQGRFIDQIANGVYCFCEMTTWVLSAHLPNQREQTRIPSHKEHAIDLTAGDMGATLAWTYHFLKDELARFSPLIPERLRSELQTRIIDTYADNGHFWWVALPYKPGALVNNWNPWCNSNVLLTTLLVEEDPDKRAAVVYKTMRSVDQFINYNHDDGACEEGPSYWGHAAGKLYDYLQVLYDATDGKLSLFDRPIIRNLGEYIYRSYIGNGWVVNFADAEARGGGDFDQIYCFGKAVGSPDMQAYAAARYRERKDNAAPVSGDLFRNFQALEHRAELDTFSLPYVRPDYSWYPETEFCYMNEGNLFLAAKGGNNNESHNHNDVGSCLVYLNRQPVLIDAGVGTYTRQTFSSERYKIWTMQSGYHNLPVINGCEQLPGGKYKASGTSFSPSARKFSADIAGAYPAEAGISRWVRSYRMKGGTLSIEDAFQGEAKQPHALHFMTAVPPSVTDRGLRIPSAGGDVLLSYDTKRLEASVETVPLTDPRLSKIWGENVYRIVLTARKAESKGVYRCTLTPLQ